MNANLQTNDSDMIRELRAAGIFVADTDSDARDIGFLFPGHGTHSSTMFDTYLRYSPAACGLIDMADEIVQDHFGFRLTDAVHGKAPLPIGNPCITQPAIFTAALAGAKMAEEHRLHPSLLLGHSLGEYAALTCSGALTVETGLRMVIDRAECVAEIPENRRGAMLAVILDNEFQMATVRRVFAEHIARGSIALGVFNGPRQVVFREMRN